MSERSILSFSKEEQQEYLKTLFLTQSTEKALSKVLVNENQNLEVCKIIFSVINEKRVKKHLKTINGLKSKEELEQYVRAMIIAILDRKKNNKILDAFINNLGKANTLKLYNFDKIDNKKILSRYMDNKKNKQENIKQNDNEIKKEKPKSKKIYIVLIIFLSLVLIGIGTYFTIKSIKLVSYYEDKIYPNFYVYDINISEKTHDELKNTLEEIKQEILSRNVKFEYNGQTKEYKVSDLGLTISSDKLLDKLTHYSDKFSFREKLKKIKSEEKEQFTLDISYDETKANLIIKELQDKYNKKKKDGNLFINKNHELKYIEGVDGFKLDDKKLKEDINNILSKFDLTKKSFDITLTGTVNKAKNNNPNLKTLNKKIATFTTNFENYGARGHNITLAASRVNGTVLQPGEVFSYRKIVGPYITSNGYQSAPVQFNGGTAYAPGGGVCQLSSTLFNAQLRAGLSTVYRANHGAPVAYVPRGLDATVSGDDPDYKFKNNYKYPVYIAAYTTATTLTVDIWTNDKATDGKTFEPYVVAKNQNEYTTYLNVYKNGKKIETKYVAYSYYIK